LCSCQYAEYEQVVVEDRIEKEKARRKVDQEAREIAAAVKVCFASFDAMHFFTSSYLQVSVV